MIACACPGRSAGQDLDTFVRDTRAAAGVSNDEVVRLANEGLAAFEGERDERVVELAYRLANALHKQERYTDADLAYGVADELARALPSTSFRFPIVCEWSYCRRMLGDYTGALEALEVALALAEQTRDDRIVAETTNEMAILRYERGETEQAIALWRQALELFEALDDSASLSLILGNLGVVHGDLGQFEASVDCIEQSLALAGSAKGGASRATNLVNLADAHRHLQDFERARKLLEEAIAHFQDIEADTQLASALTGLGLVYHDEGDPARALELLMGADEIHTRLGLNAARAAGLGQMASILGSLELHERALELSREGLQLSEAVESKNLEAAVLHTLAEGLEATGDHESALAYLRRAQELDAEVYSEASKLEMERLHVAVAAHRRDKELALQAAELERRGFERNALLVGAIALLAVAAAGWSVVLTRRRAHRELLEAFGSLQATNAELVSREVEIRAAMARITRLEGMLPICAQCKSIRGDGGEWHSLETYIAAHSDATFTHGFCPECAAALMSEVERRDTT